MVAEFNKDDDSVALELNNNQKKANDINDDKGKGKRTA